jgi:hypothetical protein
VKYQLKDGPLFSCQLGFRIGSKHVTTVPNEDGELVETTIPETKTDSIMVTANPHSLLSFVRKNVDAGLFSQSPTEFHRNN